MLFNEVRSASDELKAKIIKASGGDDWHMPWPLPNMKPIKDTEFWGWRTTYTFKGEVWAGSKQIDVDSWLPEGATVADLAASVEQIVANAVAA